MDRIMLSSLVLLGAPIEVVYRMLFSQWSSEISVIIQCSLALIWSTSGKLKCVPPHSTLCVTMMLHYHALFPLNGNTVMFELVAIIKCRLQILQTAKRPDNNSIIILWLWCLTHCLWLHLNLEHQDTSSHSNPMVVDRQNRICKRAAFCHVTHKGALSSSGKCCECTHDSKCTL